MMNAGNFYGRPYDYSHGALCLIHGLSEPLVIYYTNKNVPDGLYIGDPQITPVIDWYDAGSTLISTTTLAVQVFTLNHRNIGFDRDFGLAVDVDLSALSPPSNARFYRPRVTAPNYASLSSGMTYFHLRRSSFTSQNPMRGIEGGASGSIEGGGYIPGIMIDP